MIEEKRCLICDCEIKDNRTKLLCDFHIAKYRIRRKDKTRKEIQVVLSLSKRYISRKQIEKRIGHNFKNNINRILLEMLREGVVNRKEMRGRNSRDYYVYKVVT